MKTNKKWLILLSLLLCGPLRAMGKLGRFVLTNKAMMPMIGASMVLSNAHWQLRSRVQCASTHQQHAPSSVWQRLAHSGAITRKERISCFITDCERLEHENKAIPLHSKNDAIVRIATYNVHQWCNPHGMGPRDYNFKAIHSVISTINADIIVLQEVGELGRDKSSSLWAKLKTVGYEHHVISACRNNVVLSKYPLTTKMTKVFDVDASCPGEQRSFIVVHAQLPHNKTVALYGTHLDVWDATENRRLSEVTELARIAEESGAHHNTVVLADFNAVRERDYQYQVSNRSVWDLLKKSNQERHDSTPTKALAALEASGFQDSFARAHMAQPKFSVWSGTLIDFIFLHKKWQLPIVGCYAFYSAASDHMPIIMDVSVNA